MSHGGTVVRRWQRGARVHMDPEVAAALPELPDLHIHDLAGARARMRELAAGAAPAPGEVSVVDDSVPGAEGVQVPVRVYRPSKPGGLLPALLLLHGGGFVMGGLETTTALGVGLCTELPAVVVAVDYRLAPEHPYPAALQDVEAALRWTASEVEGVDTARIGVYGMSAGGGLAAALTLLVRDRGGPQVCFQVLDAPEVDDRLETHSARTFDDTPLWNRADAVLSWQYYLSGCDGAVPGYAAPARVDDLTGLPPAYVSVYENDPLRDEGLAYASSLLNAGVSVELHLFPGTFHRSAVIAGAAVSRRQSTETLGALRRALHPAA